MLSLSLEADKSCGTVPRMFKEQICAARRAGEENFSHKSRISIIPDRRWGGGVFRKIAGIRDNFGRFAGIRRSWMGNRDYSKAMGWASRTSLDRLGGGINMKLS